MSSSADKDTLFISNLTTKVNKSNLPSSLRNAYINFEMGDKKYKTRPTSAQGSPEIFWDDEVKLPLSGSESTLIIRLETSDRAKNTVIGAGFLDPYDLHRRKGGDQSVELQNDSGAIIGVLRFEFTFGRQKTFKGKLILKPIRAKLTVNLDTFKNQDPYLVINIGTEEKKSSVCDRGGKTPTWTDEMSFNLNGANEHIYVQCFDSDMIGKDDFIANCTLEINQLLTQGFQGRDSFDMDRNGKDGGRIWFEWNFFPRANTLGNSSLGRSKLPIDPGPGRSGTYKPPKKINTGGNKRFKPRPAPPVYRTNKPREENYVGKAPESEKRELIFTAVKAVLTIDMDTFSKQDPYLIIQTESGQKFKSFVCDSGGKYPVWNQNFHIMVDRYDNKLDIECYDKDVLKDDFIASCEIDLAKIGHTRSGLGESSIKMLRKGKVVGELFFKYKFARPKTTTGLPFSGRKDHKYGKGGSSRGSDYQYITIFPKAMEFPKTETLTSHVSPYLLFELGGFCDASREAINRGYLVKFKDAVVIPIKKDDFKNEYLTVSCYSKNYYMKDEYLSGTRIPVDEFRASSEKHRWYNMERAGRDGGELCLTWMTTGFVPDAVDINNELNKSVLGSSIAGGSRFGVGGRLGGSGRLYQSQLVLEESVNKYGSRFVDGDPYELRYGYRSVL